MAALFLASAAGLLPGLLAGCGAPPARRFPLALPLEIDPDRRPFADKPARYDSPFGWDAADHMLFRPLVETFAMPTRRRAFNVNALDEVPDSSWFENRIGAGRLSDAAILLGPCGGHPPLDPEGPWTVTGAKPDGANPGFLVKDQRGRRFLIKLDGLRQPERATSADAFGSAVFWAAGYHTPCNRVVRFDPSILRIAEDAEAERRGEEVPLQQGHVDQALRKGTWLPDGRVRALASLYLEGEPLGPWRYEGVRADDLNDVVPHQHRRELRGMYVFAAWLEHFDTREQNTLAMWRTTTPGGPGWVEHHVLDFGDSFGALWTWDPLSRRLGRSSYLDFGQIARDLFGFGVVERPWERARIGAGGESLGYYDLETFDPEGWRPGYPNPAFDAMEEEDAAWAARILARFEVRHLEGLLDQLHLEQPHVRRELSRVIRGRQRALLSRYLGALSPLTAPVVRGPRGGEALLCLEDLVITASLAEPAGRADRAAAYLGPALTPRALPVARDGARVCATLPDASGRASAPAYLIVDVLSAPRGGPAPGPARVHLYHFGGTDVRVVGLERPRRLEPPQP